MAGCAYEMGNHPETHPNLTQGGNACPGDFWIKLVGLIYTNIELLPALQARSDNLLVAWGHHSKQRMQFS